MMRLLLLLVFALPLPLAAQCIGHTQRIPWSITAGVTGDVSTITSGTVTTTAAHGLNPQDQVLLSNTGNTYEIEATPTTTTFDLQVGVNTQTTPADCAATCGTFEEIRVNGSLTGFMSTLIVTDARLADTSNGGLVVNDGGLPAVCMTVDATEKPHYLLDWSNTAGTLKLHFNADASASMSGYIYVGAATAPADSTAAFMSSLYGYWLLNETVSAATDHYQDISGNGHHMTLSGTGPTQASGCQLTDTCLYLPLSNAQYLSRQVTDIPSDFTMVYWVKTDSDAPFSQLTGGVILDSAKRATDILYTNQGPQLGAVQQFAIHVSCSVAPAFQGEVWWFRASRGRGVDTAFELFSRGRRACQALYTQMLTTGCVTIGAAVATETCTGPTEISGTAEMNAFSIYDTALSFGVLSTMYLQQRGDAEYWTLGATEPLGPAAPGLLNIITLASTAPGAQTTTPCASFAPTEWAAAGLPTDAFGVDATATQYGDACYPLLPPSPSRVTVP